MDFNSAQALLAFYDDIDILLVVTVRMVGFFMMLPILTGANVPTIPKIGLAIYISLIIVTNGSITEINYDPTIMGYVSLILKEFLSGFIMAFTVNVIFSVFYFVGQMVDYQIGYSMVSVLDPVNQTQVPITGNMFYLLITALFVTSGGLNDMVYTIAKSYEVLPIGNARIVGNVAIVQYSLDIIVNYILMGVKIAIPIVGTILIVDVALGLLTKAVPQMNVFVVGMPIKLLIGLVVLTFLIPKFMDIYLTVYNDILKYMYNMLRSMAA